MFAVDFASKESEFIVLSVNTLILQTLQDFFTPIDPLLYLFAVERLVVFADSLIGFQ